MKVMWYTNSELGPCDQPIRNVSLELVRLGPLEEHGVGLNVVGRGVGVEIRSRWNIALESRGLKKLRQELLLGGGGGSSLCLVG
jgi:hypothetical protein